MTIEKYYLNKTKLTLKTKVRWTKVPYCFTTRKCWLL